MIVKCRKCGFQFSGFLDKCPKCNTVQKSQKIVKKAGTIIKRNIRKS